jgi:RimJ/RimL family protein N-acetyltransferase
MLVFPILHTERLKLRKLEVEDIPSLVRYADNKKISDRILNMPYPYREPDAAFRMGYVNKGFKDKVRFVFSIIRKENNEFIGEISLHLSKDAQRAELGYWLGEPYWGCGMMTEAVKAVLQFGFDKLDLSAVYASSNKDNQASARVLEKNGMKIAHIRGNVIEHFISKEA